MWTDRKKGLSYLLFKLQKQSTGGFEEYSRLKRYRDSLFHDKNKFWERVVLKKCKTELEKKRKT